MKFYLEILFLIMAIFHHMCECHLFDYPKMDRFQQATGIHSTVTSKLFVPANGSELSPHCDFVMIESIPSGMYLDIDELKSQIHFGAPSIHSSSSFDVEKPESKASLVDVYVFGELTLLSGGYEGVIKLPVHLRYHEPSTTELFTTVALKSPKVMMRCANGVTGIPHLGHKRKGPCEAKTSAVCIWTEVNTSPPIGSLEFDMPVGDASDLTSILILTVLITFIAAILLTIVIYRKKNTRVY